MIAQASPGDGAARPTRSGLLIAGTRGAQSRVSGMYNQPSKAMQQTILIIEDDADIAESLEYNFKREGFRTVIAESGEKGLLLALDERRPPSLIVLDLMLPGMNGMEMCRKLRKEPATEKTPVVM